MEKEKIMKRKQIIIYGFCIIAVALAVVYRFSENSRPVCTLILIAVACISFSFFFSDKGFRSKLKEFFEDD